MKDPKDKIVSKATIIPGNFKKNFLPHLAYFEKLREWPDFCNWLQKTYKLLEEYPCHVIPEKLTFAKRLAQCLNPTLPHGTHKIALSVYSKLFKNLRLGEAWISDVPSFCIGLFPFFQNCSIQVKPEFLSIIEDTFLIMGVEILPMIVGLVTSILPGLEEQDEMLQKRIFKIFKEMRKCVGEKFFISSIWIAMLRTPKVRPPAIKLLMKEAKNKSPKPMSLDSTQESMGKSEPSQDERDKSSIIAQVRNDFAKDDPLIGASRELYDALVVDIGDNFYFKSIYFPKGSLILNATLACFEDEQAKKPMLDFLGNYLNLQDEYLSHKEKVVLMEGTIKLFEKKDISLNRRLYKWLFGGETDNAIELNSENRKNFLLIIDALKNLFCVKPSDIQEAISPIKILQNICIEHEELIEPMLQNLSVSFITYYYDASTQQGMDFGDQVSNQAEKFIDNIADYFQIVLDSFKNEIVNSTMLDKMKIMKMTKFIANKFITKETNNMSRKSSYHRGTILGILNQITQIDLSEIDRLSPKDFQLLKFGAQTVTVLVEPLLEVTTNNENILLEVCGDETFVGSLASFIDSVSKMLKTYSRQGNEVNLGPTYYTIYDLCLFTIKAFEYTQILQPLAPGEIPEWLIQIFICIKSENSAIADICLDSCMVILRTFKNLKNEEDIQYNKIWIRLRSDVLFSSKIDDILGFNLCKELVVICFNKLDLQVDSQKIIQHLLLLSNYSIDLIEDYVNDQLNDHVIEKNIRCFRQCVKLWQMTQTQADEQIHSFRGKLVFKLLKFVDHENPLMRYAARNWLQVSTSHLYNILDLVFANLLENTEFEFKPEVIHTVEYPTVQVNRCIKFMKDMLIVMGDVFSSYMATQNCTPRVAYLIPKVGEKRLLGTKSINYLDLLSVICLRYVEGTTRDTNSEFYIKNLSVKATFCEFLEMLLSKHPGHDTVYQISFYLLEPLSVVLKKSVERDESSVLIQILSVLRFILFRSNIQHDKSYKEKYFEFLQKKGFIDILVKGLSSIQLYIVIEFKDFINSLITVTSEYLRHPQLTQIVSAILSAYYSLISSNSTSSRGPKEITMASPNKNTKM